MQSIVLRVIGLVCGGGFILAFMAGGAYLLIRNLQERRQAVSSQGWPSAPGQVIATDVVQSTSTDSDGDTSTSYTPSVTYAYTVMGQEYRSDRIAFGFRQGYGRYARAQQALARYPVGAEVMVYYDPANPAQAVLERMVGGNALSLVLGIAFLAIGFCLGCPLLVTLASRAFALIGDLS